MDAVRGPAGQGALQLCSRGAQRLYYLGERVRPTEAELTGRRATEVCGVVQAAAAERGRGELPIGRRGGRRLEHDARHAGAERTAQGHELLSAPDQAAARCKAAAQGARRPRGQGRPLPRMRRAEGVTGTGGGRRRRRWRSAAAAVERRREEQMLRLGEEEA